jgi:hypothetical protein
MINRIQARFGQKGFNIYVNFQEVLLRSFNGIDNDDKLEKTYSGNVER